MKATYDVQRLSFQLSSRGSNLIEPVVNLSLMESLPCCLGSRCNAEEASRPKGEHFFGSIDLVDYPPNSLDHFIVMDKFRKIVGTIAPQQDVDGAVDIPACRLAKRLHNGESRQKMTTTKVTCGKGKDLVFHLLAHGGIMMQEDLDYQ